MDVKIIDENNIIVDGVEYEAVDGDLCDMCDFGEMSCEDTPSCFGSDRKDMRDITWEKKHQKTTHELFNEWCGERSNTHVAGVSLNGHFSSKQVGFWRAGKATPNSKSKAILGKYGFDWDNQNYDVSCGYKNGDIADINGEKVEINMIYLPENPENFTLEFEYVEYHEDGITPRCLSCDFYHNADCIKMSLCKKGYIIKRAKKYIPLTRETAKIGQPVRQTTESGYLHGTISYIKKHQDQCVVDWGTSETTICFASLEILED